MTRDEIMITKRDPVTKTKPFSAPVDKMVIPQFVKIPDSQVKPTTLIHGCNDTPPKTNPNMYV